MKRHISIDLYDGKSFCGKQKQECDFSPITAIEYYRDVDCQRCRSLWLTWSISIMAMKLREERDVS